MRGSPPTWPSTLARVDRQRIISAYRCTNCKQSLPIERWKELDGVTCPGCHDIDPELVRKGIDERVKEAVEEAAEENAAGLARLRTRERRRPLDNSLRDSIQARKSVLVEKKEELAVEREIVRLEGEIAHQKRFDRWLDGQYEELEELAEGLKVQIATGKAAKDDQRLLVKVLGMKKELLTMVGQGSRQVGEETVEEIRARGKVAEVVAQGRTAIRVAKVQATAGIAGGGMGMGGVIGPGGQVNIGRMLTVMQLPKTEEADRREREILARLGARQTPQGMEGRELAAGSPQETILDAEELGDGEEGGEGVAGSGESGLG